VLAQVAHVICDSDLMLRPKYWTWNTLLQCCYWCLSSYKV